MRKKSLVTKLEKVSKKLKYISKSEVKDVIARHHELENLYDPKELVAIDINFDEKDKEFKKAWKKIQQDAKTLKVSVDAVIGHALMKSIEDYTKNGV